MPKQYCILISWKDEDVEPTPWIYGRYDHEPTEAEQASARTEFMEETTTSEMDWSEFGCFMQVHPLIQPPEQRIAWSFILTPDLNDGKNNAPPVDVEVENLDQLTY